MDLDQVIESIAVWVREEKVKVEARIADCAVKRKEWIDNWDSNQEIHKWTVGTTSDPPTGAGDNASLSIFHLDQTWRNLKAAEACLFPLKELEARLKVALCTRSTAVASSSSNNNIHNSNNSFAQRVVNGGGPIL